MPTSEAASLVTSATSNAIAMLEMLRQARAMLGDCYDLLITDLESVPDDLLREATNDIFEIREIAGEIYDPIAFQIAENELAELEAEDAVGTPPAETASQLTVGAQESEAVDVFGNHVPSESAVDPLNARDQAETRLKLAYTSLMRRIRNRGREKSHETAYRERLLANFRACVAAISDEDRAYLEHQEAGYLDRAAKLQKQVNTMLKFWDMPAIAGEGRLHAKDMSQA